GTAESLLDRWQLPLPLSCLAGYPGARPAPPGTSDGRRPRESESHWCQHSCPPQVPFPENIDIDRRGVGCLEYATEAGMDSSTSVPESGLLERVSLPSTTFARSCMPCKPWCPSRYPSSRIFGSTPFPLSRTSNRKCRSPYWIDTSIRRACA